MSDMELSYQVAELRRQMNNSVTLAKITAVDAKTCRVKVSIGEASQSDYLPVLSARASEGDKTVWLPEKGEQVVVLALTGDINKGFVLGSLLRVNDSPGRKSWFTSFGNGSSFEYDKERNHLDINLKDGATVSLKAPGGTLTFDTGELVVNGALTVSGEATFSKNVTAKEDVKTSKTTLNTHTHKYVAPLHPDPAGPKDSSKPGEGL